MGMKIIVIDNGSQYAHRIYRTFQDLDVDVEILLNTTSFEKVESADAIILSGSSGLVSQGASMGNCPLYLEKFNGPILGICAGHQLIASFFGGKVQPAVESATGTPEFGKTEIFVDNENDLFKGLPKNFFVWESHNDEVSGLSDKLECLAHSKTCANEAIKHIGLPIYGLQFHPEVQHTEFGHEIYANFLEIVKNFSEKKLK